ncbi:efflux RND transporter periplasmic adaptor subunit [Photobacterium atrarenae]|uniref:Efflux RND transporter periplasmic adaptor subunit n=1 Tax=Photobacterium atrarenae TaxID=865757 RepID=A0ABY5GJU1_9GAMM|nr:efflux RND transporter periplasmic adaptor subunit [Photobacterium atrarenae]UTV29587.1 efflux RND transporter periplasmic adaptor subunit [Photobacterium atrarenae]
MNTVTTTTLALLIGAVLGVAGTQLLWKNPSVTSSESSGSTASSVSNEPLYWVAPMDPNYKRDKPGKSPMGMDLIPVYADDVAGSSTKPGTVKIDPAVENNLGVKTAPVELGKLSPRISTVGYIAFDESRLWQTNVRVSGWVEKLMINAIGEQVRQGDVLFTLYSPDLVKAQEELLNASWTGRTALVKGAQERLVSLGVDRAQIQQVLRRGRAAQTIQIKAPADGVIASLNVREGAYLSPAQAVISAGPLHEVWVDAEVFERQGHWIKAGSRASMTLDALPGRAWEGAVDYVYPILDPKTRTLRMRLKFSNPKGELKPNMFANITLQPVTAESVLTIPKSAVIRSGGMSRVVLAEGEGNYRSARIKVGREADDKIEVLQGLTEADRVVTSAHFMLDSESSQSADLSRINGVEAVAETVRAKGEVTAVMAEHRMLTIRHQPVPEWDWPGMTMDFTVNAELDMSIAQPGQPIEFEIRKTEDGQYEVVDFKVDEHAPPAEAWIRGEITMLMADFGMVTVKHEPVDVWQWDAGEINFSVGEDIDLSGLAEGDLVRLLVRQQGGEYALQSLEKAGEQP